MSDELPPGWAAARLADVAHVRLGKTPRSSDYRDSGQHRVIKFRDVTNEGLVLTKTKKGFVDDSQDVIRTLEPLRVGDVLLTASAHSGDQIGKKTAYVDRLPDDADAFFFVGELLGVTANKKAIVGRWPQFWFMSRGFVEGPVAKGMFWRATYYGGGVRIVNAGDPVRQTLEVDASVLSHRYGARLVAALLRVMAGVNRIAALLHFIKLNSEHVDDGSVSSERNFHFAALLTFAYLKELFEALGDLSGAGIKRHLRELDPWRQLQDLETYWITGNRKTVRNEVMFHLGDIGPATKSIEAQADARFTLPLLDSDPDPTGMPARFTAGEALVMTASGLTLMDYAEIATRAVASYGPLVTSVFRIMDDLLRQCGANMPALESRPVTLIAARDTTSAK